MQLSDAVAIVIFISVIAIATRALWELIPIFNLGSIRRPKSDLLRATVHTIWSPIGIFGVFLIIASTLFLLVAPTYTEKEGLYTNLGTEGLGIVVTILAIGILNEWQKIRGLKARLIRDMGGQANDFALRAVRELRVNGWLMDGTLQNAVLWKANLKDADMVNANLKGIQAAEANFEGANLSQANLESAILGLSNLKGTHLLNTNLEGATLVAANFDGAILFGANLKDASLWGANFNNSFLQEADLTGAKYSEGTIWPRGYTPPPEAIYKTR